MFFTLKLFSNDRLLSFFFRFKMFHILSHGRGIYFITPPFVVGISVHMDHHKELKLLSLLSYLALSYFLIFLFNLFGFNSIRKMFQLKSSIFLLKVYQICFIFSLLVVGLKYPLFFTFQVI